MHCQILACNELENENQRGKDSETVSKQNDLIMFVSTCCFDNASYATVDDLISLIVIICLIYM